MSTMKITRERRECSQCGQVRPVLHHQVKDPFTGKIAFDWIECPVHGVIEGEPQRRTSSDF